MFLPILQGILFLMIGLIILSSEYVWAHRLVEKVRMRFPKAAALFDEASERARSWSRALQRGPVAHSKSEPR